MDYNLFLDSVKSADADLRPYQSKNKNRIYESWKEHNAVMLQMPTGTGKTRLFVSLLRDIHCYAAKIRTQIRVLILVHRIELIDQISYELGVRYGLAHGIIHSQDRERPMFPFQIASVQTLNRRLDRWSERTFDFIIVDEAHHVLAESYKKIINTYPNAKVLGVTATPYRLSGAGFRPEFDVLIESESIREFIKKGYLSDYEYYSIAPFSQMQHQIDDITKVDSSGDYANSELMEICDKNKIRAQVVEAYLKYAKGKKGIVYTINKLHNKHLCESFCESGVSAVAIDSDTSTEERERLIQQFKRGEIDVLCNVDIFSEGFDCPDIEFVQLARPTKSLSLYLQQVGRGLRVCEGKEKTIFLDNVGLYNSFGFPAEKRPWQGYFDGVEGVVENKIKRERKTDSTKLRNIVRDLTEGNEKVYLIHSTSEFDYVYDRFRLIYKWIERNIYLYLLYLGSLNEKQVEKFLRRSDDKGIRLIKNIVDCKEIVETGFTLVHEDIDPLITWIAFNKNTTYGWEIYNQVEIDDNSYFLEYVKNDDIDTIEKYKQKLRFQFLEYCFDDIKKYIYKYTDYKKLKSEIKKQRISTEEYTEAFTFYNVVEHIFPEKNDNVYDEVMDEYAVDNKTMRAKILKGLLYKENANEYLDDNEIKVLELKKAKINKS